MGKLKIYLNSALWVGTPLTSTSQQRFRFFMLRPSPRHMKLEDVLLRNLLVGKGGETGAGSARKNTFTVFQIITLVCFRGGYEVRCWRLLGTVGRDVRLTCDAYATLGGCPRVTCKSREGWNWLLGGFLQNRCEDVRGFRTVSSPVRLSALSYLAPTR